MATQLLHNLNSTTNDNTITQPHNFDTTTTNDKCNNDNSNDDDSHHNF